MNHIPCIVDAGDNDMLNELSTVEEIKRLVFELTSVSGPDGLSGLFYQSCWDIVCTDIVDVVHSFFQGHTIPKFITHTN